jgi:predicted phosphodiesterase|tara:strand:- start:2279 stop:3058 length:780 start_codon:yes stop_codon:yes gene_type:complete
MPKKKSHRRAVVIPDTHFPLQAQEAINCVLKAIKLVKPNIFICLGDLGEWYSVSPWRYKRRKRPPLEYVIDDLKVESEAVNAGLDSFDKALDSVGCKEKHMMEGNHDDWLNKFVSEFPYLSQYKFKNIMDLDGRGYKYYPYGKYMKLGKAYFYHGGHYMTANHTRQHAMNLGKNIIYGHVHDVQRSGVTHVDGPHHAFSLGCLKNMSMESNIWLKGRQVNWAHAFAIMDFFDNGNFRIDVVDIHKGKTFVWGQAIDGNK